MHHIQSYRSNSGLICSSNMCLPHIGSDCRQLLGVLLGHPHPHNGALSSSRELAMQGDALLFGSLAGRCNHQAIHPPPSRFARDQPIYLLCYRLPTVGWTPIINRLVSCGAWRLALRRRLSQMLCQLWAIVCALNFWGSFVASWSSQLCLGQSLFLVRNIWGCFSPEPRQIILGNNFCLRHWGGLFCHATHKNLRWTLAFCLLGSA